MECGAEKGPLEKELVVILGAVLLPRFAHPKFPADKGYIFGIAFLTEWHGAP
jgi:hypothetical protein